MKSWEKKYAAGKPARLPRELPGIPTLPEKTTFTDTTQNAAIKAYGDERTKLEAAGSLSAKDHGDLANLAHAARESLRYGTLGRDGKPVDSKDWGVQQRLGKMSQLAKIRTIHREHQAWLTPPEKPAEPKPAVQQPTSQPPTIQELRLFND